MAIENIYTRSISSKGDQNLSFYTPSCFLELRISRMYIKSLREMFAALVTSHTRPML